MASNTHQYPLVKLPHPYLTTYRVNTVDGSTPAKRTLTFDQQPAKGRSLPKPLHSDSLSWLDLTFIPKAEQPPISDNTPWGRARRSPQTVFQWMKEDAPSLGQIWNVVHAIYLAHPTIEYFRLTLSGTGEEVIHDELLKTGLAIKHPKNLRDRENKLLQFDDLLVLRSAFWQGAASPMGPRPIWVVGDGTDGPMREPLSQYPVMPENYQITNKFPEEPVYTRHPTRRPKPHPKSIVYSRYIPEINEHFSLEVVDWESAEHVQLFNKWQNDPRVAAGWNETGTIAEHTEYLRKLHFDPHVLCLFGRFDDTRFSYYELYWSKVRPFHIPVYHESILMLSKGGPLRSALRCWRLRSWPSLPSRRLELPRRPPCECLVLQLHPLRLPG